MTGAVTAFASNFFFSQGPWTPWQMMAYGIGGFVAGVLYRKGMPAGKYPWLATAVLSGIGFVMATLIVGPLLDTCTVFLAPISMNLKSIMAIYISGFTVNISQGISTFLVMFLLGKPLLEKLDRIRVKYGMMEEDYGL